MQEYFKRPIYKLPVFNNFQKLVDDCNQLIKEVPFKNGLNQISLQLKDPSDDSDKGWYESTGGQIVNKQMFPSVFEDVYSHLNPKLKGTAIEEWLNSFGFSLFRARLMLMYPRTCYSIHKDPYPRIHIPIITNMWCMMCYPESKIMEHMPATGNSYFVNTTIPHTMMNASTLNRIHLVAVVKPTKDVINYVLDNGVLQTQD